MLASVNCVSSATLSGLSVNQKLTEGEWNEALRIMKKHQIIEYPGALRDVEDKTPIYIYSTINIYCSAAMLPPQEAGGADITEDIRTAWHCTVGPVLL